MEQFHSLLTRQLRRVGIDIAKKDLSDSYMQLLKHVNQSYIQFDEGRYITERSLDIYTQEMNELRTRLQQEKDIMEAVISEGFCVLNPLWKIATINQTACTLLNISSEGTKGKHFDEVFILHEGIDSPDKKIDKSFLVGKLKTNSNYQCERGLVYVKNHFVPVALSINPLPPLKNTEFGGAVMIIRDISERLHTEIFLRNSLQVAEQSNKAKSIFLANMSHEIRTPMNAILGMLQLLMHTELTKKQSNYAERCHQSAESLLSIIGDLLDFSKIEAGKTTFERIEFNLRNEINSVVELFQSVAGEKNIQLEFIASDKIPSVLCGDPLRIKQIVNNLVSNALKFTPCHGKVTVTVFEPSDYENEIVIKMSVSDTGVGIPKDKQSIIFDLFSQADDSTTRKYGGTGLGLAIVKQLVEQMGGEVFLRSIEGKGSTFAISFKLTRSC